MQLNRREVLAGLFSALPLGQALSRTPVSVRTASLELTEQLGWFAVIYPWEFLPEQSPVHPIPELATPYRRQTPGQIDFQNRLLNMYGSALDILSFNPHPDSPDYNHWLATYFRNGSRPFFLLWEHLGSGFLIRRDGTVDMDDPYNRKVFMDNLGFMFCNVVFEFPERYVTLDGRAVFYLWSSGSMVGDLAGVMEEAGERYPVSFIAGGGENSNDIKRLAAFDGWMEYSIAGFSGPSRNYQDMVANYLRHAAFKRRTLDEVQSLTGKKKYVIPTFQAAYDETLIRPPRQNALAVYPETREEMVENARQTKQAMVSGEVFDNLGPLVVWSEWPEGASVGPSIPFAEKAGRYVGYGTGRVDIVAQFFRAGLR